MRIAGQASFLTGDDHTIHAWVHGPQSGQVRGAVVVAPALAREEVVSHRSMRLVAARAAQAGWLVVRMAWSGTSESGERPPGSDPVQVWHRDLAVAYGAARELVGPELPVHGIGLRIGASVLATSGLPFEKRLLWEPVSGAVYMRQYTGLRRASGLDLPPEVDSGVEIGGAHFTGEEAAAIRALPDPRKLATPGLEPVREEDRAVAKKLYGVAAIYAKSSPEAIASLVARLDGPQEDASERADVSSWQPRTTARFHVAEFGVDVVEELLELGEDLLPASYTHPVGRDGTGVGAVLLAPPSADPKDGPTGLWTVQARRLAARGVPAIRVERHHCGDAAGLDELKDINPYTGQGVADLDLGAAWLKERTGEEITGVGLCVGGWLVAMAPPTSAMTSRVVLNNVAWRAGETYYDKLYRNWDVDAVLEQLRTMADVEVNASWRTRAKNRVRRRMPYPVWLALGRRNIPNVPEVVMEYASRSAEVLFCFGPEDGLLFRQERGEEGLARLTRQGRRIRVAQVPALDHSLQACASRRTALQIVDAALGLSAFPQEEVAPCAV
ncbi:dienelactone hydrolase [Kocuria rhizophila]|uniref:hypothetical protein n=1 Tax=Kocuria rhizophila TaxID=72000 RepID=UPI00285841AA|nr:hypothetical protein [Kocuria rhizophila]MDR7374235.1 dienelactone hydrolase [Kocuria rhizophila]WSY88227.1 hypothetical protein OH783_11365 [Kocuria rhizophila]WSZ53654.1 hypothetical protein OG926_11420 [Kocuria rhizophila]